MKLSHLLAEVSGAHLIGDGGVSISSVCYDSRRAGPGCLFVAIPGSNADGHDYVGRAVDAGAVAVAVQADREAKWRPVVADAGVPALVVRDARAALAALAAALYGHPARKLGVIGVTGTDGKTTTTHLTAALLEAGGYPTAYLSSVEFGVEGVARLNDTHMTTLESLETQAFLAEAVAAGDRFAVIEASSHGLALHRVDRCEFDAGIFTTLTADHLDFHGTLEAYREDKGHLFRMLDGPAKKGVPRAAVLNADDAASTYFAGLTRVPVITYGFREGADVRATDLRPQALASCFRLHAPVGDADVRLPLPGAFNVMNALAAAAAAGSQGVSLADVVRGLESFAGVPGRMEYIEAGQPFAVVVDIASTASALRNVLDVLRPATSGRLCVVFGCAGERDPGRRDGMGRVAAELADFAVLTSEDPRSEDPEAIIDAIAGSMTAAGHRQGDGFVRLPDRREAIACAFRWARPGDTVLLAGKGTEQSMVFGREHVPWDERSVARGLLQEMLPGA